MLAIYVRETRNVVRSNSSTLGGNSVKSERSKTINRVTTGIVGTTLLLGAASSLRAHPGEPASTPQSSSAQPQSAQETTQQSKPAQQATQLQAVTVTARKQEELLQSIPLTVFAFSQAQLENIAPKTLFDLTLLAPGLNYQEISGGRAGSRIQMRGISGGNTGASRASVFLDGIYLSGTVNNMPFQFLQRV